MLIHHETVLTFWVEEQAYQTVSQVSDTSDSGPKCP